MKIPKYACLFVLLLLVVPISNAIPQEENLRKLDSKISNAYAGFTELFNKASYSLEKKEDFTPHVENMFNYFSENNILLTIWTSDGKILKTKKDFIGFWNEVIQSGAKNLTFEETKKEIIEVKDKHVLHIAYIIGQFSCEKSPPQTLGGYMLIGRHPFDCEW